MFTDSGDVERARPEGSALKYFFEVRVAFEEFPSGDAFNHVNEDRGGVLCAIPAGALASLHATGGSAVAARPRGKVKS